MLLEALTEQSRSPFEPTLAECLREGFVKPSRCLREAFQAMGSPWRLREGFATSSRALREDVAGAEGFEKRPRSLREAFSKASPIPTEASWSLVEGYARHSWRLHLKTIRQIMTSPLHLRILLRIIVVQRKRRDYRMTSYDPALEKISAFESNGPTLRTRRRLWAGTHIQ